MVSGLDLLRQNFFVPKPSFTEKDAPDQTGKVHIVTGGYSGVGYELAQILFSKNATVYVAGRDATKAKTAIDKIKKVNSSSKGRLEYLKLDLADLASIKTSVEEFTTKETKLHVLTNNAGVNGPPLGSKTPQGFDLQLGTNNLGPFLFTKLLLPILRSTASSEPADTVRVTWAASFAVELVGPEGIPSAEDGTPKFGDNLDANYYATKVGNAYYGVELARRHGKDGIVSVAFNPGNLKSDIMRHMPGVKAAIMGSMFYPPKNGAITELYSALSPDISLDNNGAYIFPWGRIGGLKKLESAIKPKDAHVANSGKSELFWDWSEKTVQPFA